MLNSRSSRLNVGYADEHVAIVVIVEPYLGLVTQVDDHLGVVVVRLRFVWLHGESLSLPGNVHGRLHSGIVTIVWFVIDNITLSCGKVFD